MKRGQAAMEFLMTYGWAVLVVLIAIAALAYFGVLNPAKFLPSSCTIAPGIGCEEFKIAETGESLIRLRNAIGEDLVNVTVAIGSTNTNCSAPYEMPLKDGGLLECSVTLTGLTAEERFKEDIEVTYIKSGQSIRHTRTGTITTKVE